MTLAQHACALVLPLLVAIAPAQGPAPEGAPQESPTATEQVSAETLRELVATIQDPERREQLVSQLQALLAAMEQTTEEAVELTLIEELSAFFRGLTDRLGETAANLIEQVAMVPDLLQELWDGIQDPDRRAEMVADVSTVIGVVLAGLLAALVTSLLLKRPRSRLGKRKRETPLGTFSRIVRLLLRGGIDVLPAIAAVAAAAAVLTVAPLDRVGGAVAIAIVWAVATQRVARAVIALLLSPTAPDIRLPAVGDDMAEELARSLRRASAVAVFGYFGVAIVDAAGGGEDLLDPLRNVYALVLLIIAVSLILKFRTRFHAIAAERREEEARLVEAEAAKRAEQALTAEAEEGREAEPEETPTPTIQGPPPPDDDLLEPDEQAVQGSSYWRGLGRLALGLWWVVALVYVAGLYMLWLTGVEDGFGAALESTALTVVWIAVAFVAAALVHRTLARLENRVTSWVGSVPAIRTSVPRYTSLLRAVLDIVIALITFGFVLQAWGVEAVEALDSAVLRDAVSTILGVLVVVLLALATIDVSTALAQSYLERKERSSQGSGKVRTLVPLANKTIKFVVTVLAGLMVLSQLGVAIGPILASVGVLGLAVGFGAQTLVKDVITGVFYLIEDTVSVGDVAMVGSTGGVVEAINIRTLQLRDLSGNLHTIPYGTIDKLTNYTKEYGRYLIECGVAYREDVDHVIEVLRQLGDEMLRDPVYGPKMLDPIEIMGVDRFEDSAVIIRARLKTKPLEQWSTGREFNRRMKKRFDELGIEIPFPHRTLYMGEDKSGRAPALHIARDEAPTGG